MIKRLRKFCLQPCKPVYLSIGLGIIAVQAFVLWLLGQPLICTCGYVKLWEGLVLGPGNSQHLTDWYTFSHIVHGFLFYGALTAVFPRMPVGMHFLLALGIESSWEMWENTPYIINKYRETALAQGYTGDSIVNSISDTISMVIGFMLARRLPIIMSVFVVIALELFVGFVIHDNLTLNILSFFHQFDFIVKWQSGA